ncbi:MAG: hypothetical protein QW625_01910 [Candidatus Nanoarchaeia archaeon]
MAKKNFFGIVLVLALVGILAIIAFEKFGATGGAVVETTDQDGNQVVIICPESGAGPVQQPPCVEKKGCIPDGICTNDESILGCCDCVLRCLEGHIFAELANTGELVCVEDFNNNGVPDACEAGPVGPSEPITITLPQDKITAIFPLSLLLKVEKNIDIWGIEKKEIVFENYGTVLNRLYNKDDESYIDIISLEFNKKDLKFRSLTDPSEWTYALLDKCYSGYTTAAAPYGYNFYLNGAEIGKLRTPSEPKPPVKNIEVKGTLSAETQGILEQLSNNLNSYSYACKFGLEIEKEKSGTVEVKQDQRKCNSATLVSLWDQLKQKAIEDLAASTGKEKKIGIEILYQPEKQAYTVELNSNDCIAETVVFVEGEKQITITPSIGPWCEIDYAVFMDNETGEEYYDAAVSNCNKINEECLNFEQCDNYPQGPILAAKPAAPMCMKGEEVCGNICVPYGSIGVTYEYCGNICVPMGQCTKEICIYDEFGEATGWTWCTALNQPGEAGPGIELNPGGKPML